MKQVGFLPVYVMDSEDEHHMVEDLLVLEMILFYTLEPLQIDIFKPWVVEEDVN